MILSSVSRTPLGTVIPTSMALALTPNMFLKSSQLVMSICPPPASLTFSTPFLTSHLRL